MVNFIQLTRATILYLLAGGRLFRCLICLSGPMTVISTNHIINRLDRICFQRGTSTQIL